MSRSWGGWQGVRGGVSRATGVPGEYTTPCMDDITIHGGDGTNSSHLVEFVGAGVDLPGEQDVEDLGEEVAPHAVHPQLEVGGHLGRHGAGLVAQAGALVGGLGRSEGWDGWRCKM